MDRLLTMEAFLRVVDAGSFSAAGRAYRERVRRANPIAVAP
jgi:hypothetical protein